MTKKDKSVYPLPRRIKSLNDVRRLISRLIPELRAGTLESKDARTLTYMLITYVRVFKESDLESRVQELEEFGRNGKP